jgi:hypothetical protein
MTVVAIVVAIVLGGWIGWRFGLTPLTGLLVGLLGLGLGVCAGLLDYDRAARRRRRHDRA